MKKKLVFSSMFVVMLMVSVLASGMSVFGHGYIQYPESRVYLANLGINKDVGAAQWEPQSIEATKGFPEAGPADGQIAGGGGKYPKLDEQTEDRWAKVDVKSGKVDFTWELTAAHRTSGWKYYITKKGWNPNKALSRDQLELLTEIEADGSVPQRFVTQSIDIPSDREGYYIILGIWEIADTSNAFYQVIDANIINPVKPEIKNPIKPIVGNLPSKKAISNNLKCHGSVANSNKMNHDRWYMN